MKIVFHCILNQNPMVQNPDAPVVTRFVLGLIRQMDKHSARALYHDPLKIDGWAPLIQALTADDTFHILVPFGRGNQDHLCEFMKEHPQSLSQTTLVLYKGSWGAIPQTALPCPSYNIVQPEPKDPMHNHHWAKSALVLPEVIEKKIEAHKNSPVSRSVELTNI